MRKALLAATLIAALVAGCSDGPTAERVLRQNGYSKVGLHGWAAFSCGKDDTYATAFTAIAPGGQQVSGTVCSGLFKGATIRFD